MKTSVNFEEYIARMESMTDKITVLDYLPEGARVLDYGCGSGPMAHYFEPHLYVGYDIAPEMVERARRENPDYTFTDSLEFAAEERFDAVIFSSLLHEVYSYNGYSYLEVIKTLTETHSLLRPNGVIIIRDGIAPPGGEAPWSLRLQDPQDASDFLEHLKATSPQTFDVSIESGRLSGSKAALIHFLNIYTWGWESVEREKYERVNFATLQQWLSLLSASRYEVRELNVISQPDYFKHLEKLVALEGRQWETKIFMVAAPAL